MKRLLIIIGTRPEAIKMAPVIRTLRKHSQHFATRVCLTGQHKEMLYQALEYFDISYDYDLSVMQPAQSLSMLTERLTSSLQTVFEAFEPAIALVQGDTTTAFVGALLAHYNKVKLGHVEAGLRTNDKYAPFPEEMNRRLVTVLADYHFAPTPLARKSLLHEGVNASHICVTGNTVIDALLYTIQKVRTDPPPIDELEPLLASGRRIVLVTGHRRENFGTGFRSICNAIRTTAAAFPDVTFVYPVHLNPQVRKPVHELLGTVPNVHLMEPMGYVPFIRLMNAAHFILTDSGGIQEEAPSLGKPVLVMRDVTERQEAVDAGAAILVGCNPERITAELSRLLTSQEAYDRMSQISNPFGDGHASLRIVEFLKNTDQ